VKRFVFTTGSFSVYFLSKSLLFSNMIDEIGPTEEGQPGFTTGAESMQQLDIQLPYWRDIWSC
jgi:hypothetical protein